MSGGELVERVEEVIRDYIKIGLDVADTGTPTRTGAKTYEVVRIFIGHLTPDVDVLAESLEAESKVCETRAGTRDVLTEAITRGADMGKAIAYMDAATQLRKAGAL